MLTSKIPAIQQSLDFLREYLPTHQLIKKVYVFGSVAEGKETEESDIDLAIVCEDRETLMFCGEWFAHLELGCSVSVDYIIRESVHDFESLDNWHKAVVLYERQS